MTANAFMWVAPILMFGLYLAVRGLRRLSVRYPGTAFARFTSTREMGDYFGFAWQTLRRHRWLGILAIALPLSNYLVQVWGWLIMRSHLARDLPSSWGTAPITLTRVVQALLDTFLGLHTGYHFFGSSVFVAIALVVSVLIHKQSIRKLQAYVGGETNDGLVFLKRWSPICISLILLTGIPFAVALILRLAGFVVAFGIAFFGVLTVAGLLGISLGEGALLFFVKDVTEGTASGRRDALRRALGIVEPLFYLNLVLSAILSIPSWLGLPGSLLMFTGKWLSPPVMYRLWMLGRYTKFGSAAMAACLVCAPISLVFAPSGVRQALRSNFDFVGRYFLKYVIMVGVGAALLFLPGLLSLLVASVIPRVSLVWLITEMLTKAVSVYLAVLFMLAIFRFYYAYRPAQTPLEVP